MELNKETVKKILLLAFIVILIYLCTKNIYVILKAVGTFVRFIFPFLLGAIFAFVLNVLMRFIEGNLKTFEKKINYKIKNRRLISFLFTIIIVLGIISVICFLVIPEFTSTVKMLWNNAPKYWENIKNILDAAEEKIPVLTGVIESIKKLGSTEKSDIDFEEIGYVILDVTGGQVGTMVTSTFDIISNIVSGVVNFLIAIVFSCYILFQKEHLSEQGKKILYASMPEKFVERFITLGKLIDDTFSRFMIGQCMEALILGSMFVVSMLIFRMPYAFLIGALVSVTALIPIVGSTIACVVGAVLMLTVSPMKMVFFIILFLALQQIESHFIYPNVVGNTIGLPALWVLLALTVGAKLLGIGGLLIAIPTMSVIYVLIEQWIHSGLERRNVPEEKWKNEERSDAERKKEEKFRQRFQVIKFSEKFPAKKLKEKSKREGNENEDASEIKEDSDN